MSPAHPSMAVRRYSWLPSAHRTSASFGRSTSADSAANGLMVTTPPSAWRAATSAVTSATSSSARSAEIGSHSSSIWRSWGRTMVCQASDWISRMRSSP